MSPLVPLVPLALLAALALGAAPALAQEEEPLEPLPCPAGVHVVWNAKGSIVLVWEPVAEAAAYNVYRSTQGGALAPIGSTLAPDTDFQDLDIENGVTYEYAITAYPHHGALESAGCDALQVTAVPEFGAPVLVALGALGGVGAYAALRRR